MLLVTSATWKVQEAFKMLVDYSTGVEVCMINCCYWRLFVARFNGVVVIFWSVVMVFVLNLVIVLMDRGRATN